MEIEAYSGGFQSLSFMCAVSHIDDEDHSDDEGPREGERDDSQSNDVDLHDQELEVEVDDHSRIELFEEMVG